MATLPREKVRELRLKSLMESFRGLSHALLTGKGDKETNWQTIISMANQIAAEAARIDGIDQVSTER